MAEDSAQNHQTRERRGMVCVRGIEIRGVLKTQVTRRFQEDGLRETTFIPCQRNSRTKPRLQWRQGKFKDL